MIVQCIHDEARWFIGLTIFHMRFCLIRQSFVVPIVCFSNQSKFLCTTKSFESIILTNGIWDAFSKKNQTSWGDRVHPTLASRNSDSDFAPDLSVAGLHITDPANQGVSAKTRITLTILDLHL